jgi:hypothetical protein
LATGALIWVSSGDCQLASSPFEGFCDRETSFTTFQDTGARHPMTNSGFVKIELRIPICQFVVLNSLVLHTESIQYSFGSL